MISSCNTIVDRRDHVQYLTVSKRPKMPFGQRHVAINIYNICKGHLGSRGAKHLKIN